MPDDTFLAHPGQPLRTQDTAPPTEPVERPDAFLHDDAQPPVGMGLCLSGGGYRAMLFHLGVLWRLNEFGMLRKFDRISSVSGGSITSAYTALKWNELQWTGNTATNFDSVVADRICALADHTIDVGSGILGILLPGQSISDRIIKSYREHLYGKATLRDLPDDRNGQPTFIINATNVQTGALFRFSRRYMADYRVGRADDPDVALALVVAASSAFPPVLSPARMKLDAGKLKPSIGADLNREPFTTDIMLTDGGVYDNLGLETVWKRCATVIVSDGGGQMEAEAKPHTNWAQHALRINGLIDNQVRALRKRQVVASFASGVRKGAYFRMRNDINEFNAPDKLRCPFDRTYELATLSTRLAKLPREMQRRVINWGYALSDAAIRTWYDPTLPAPQRFPLDGGV